MLTPSPATHKKGVRHHQVEGTRGQGDTVTRGEANIEQKTASKWTPLIHEVASKLSGRDVRHRQQASNPQEGL